MDKGFPKLTQDGLAAGLVVALTIGAAIRFLWLLGERIAFALAH